MKSSVELIDFSGNDLSIVNAARVSFNKMSDFESDGTLKTADVKLIDYLAKHKHLSPFNHAFISLRVKAPIFVARQLVKHEYLVWNEVSRRYVDTPPEIYIPDGWRARADNVKQGSSGEFIPNNEFVMAQYHSIVDEILKLYTEFSELDGVCPEQARMILPHSLMTEWVWSGTLGAFAKMLSLRLPTDTQKETRDVAEIIYNTIEPIFPISLTALLKHTYNMEIV